MFTVFFSFNSGLTVCIDNQMSSYFLVSDRLLFMFVV